MNDFEVKFDERIEHFFDEPDKQQALLADVLQYANANPHAFRKNIKEIQFNRYLAPLSVVFEALAVDTDTWGNFYVETLDEIFDEAVRAKKPKDVLFNLAEYFYIAKDTRPFVQKIVDRVIKQIDTDNVAIKIAAINMLIDYLPNPSINNKQLIMDTLIRQLNSNYWKVRYATYTYLKLENLLPAGQKRLLKDQLLRWVLGDPSF